MNNTSKYRILAISFASYTSIFLALIPLIYVSNQFTPKQIAFLSSMYTFGAIIQPLFSVLTNKVGIKKTLIFNLIVALSAAVVLFISENFIVYAICVTVYYVFQAPNIGLMDNLLKLIAEQKDISFGMLRAFISAGWGIGTVIVLPFIMFMDNKIILLLVVAFIIITIIGVFQVDINDQGETTQDSKFDLSFLRNKTFRKVFILSTILMGSWGIKSSFQTLLLMEKTSQTYIISIVSVISIVIELALIPRVEYLYRRFGYKKMVIIACIAGIILTFGYSQSTSLLAIVALSSLHGVLCGIMIPLNIFKIRKILDIKHFNTAMLLMYSVQNLFAFILITLIINPIYVSLNVSAVYLFLSGLIGALVLIVGFIKIDNNSSVV